MVADPADKPVTVPDETVATAGLLLLQVPPGVASPKEMEDPGQTPETPEIAAGKGFTVTDAVTKVPEV